MDDGKTPASPLTSSKAEPRPTPTDAELSKIAREAVHQPADPRLDRHLQAMGLVDAPDSSETADSDLGQPVTPSVDPGVTIELLDRRLRRAEVSVAVLAVVVVVLAIVEVIQLIR